MQGIPIVQISPQEATVKQSQGVGTPSLFLLVTLRLGKGWLSQMCGLAMIWATFNPIYKHISSFLGALSLLGQMSLTE